MGKPLKLNRLSEVQAEAALEAAGDVGGHSKPAQCDGAHSQAVFPPLCKFAPIPIRKSKVGDQDIDRVFGKNPKRQPEIAGFKDLVPKPADHSGENFARGFVVVHKKDPKRCWVSIWCGGDACRRSGLFGSWRLQGELDVESCSSAWPIAFGRDHAAVAFHQTPRDAQP